MFVAILITIIVVSLICWLRWPVLGLIASVSLSAALVHFLQLSVMPALLIWVMLAPLGWLWGWDKFVKNSLDNS